MKSSLMTFCTPCKWGLDGNNNSDNSVHKRNGVNNYSKNDDKEDNKFGV